MEIKSSFAFQTMLFVWEKVKTVRRVKKGEALYVLNILIHVYRIFNYVSLPVWNYNSLSNGGLSHLKQKLINPKTRQRITVHWDAS